MSVLFLRGRHHLTELMEEKISQPDSLQGTTACVWSGEEGNWEDLVLGNKKGKERDPYTGTLQYSLGKLVDRPCN